MHNISQCCFYKSVRLQILAITPQHRQRHTRLRNQDERFLKRITQVASAVLHERDLYLAWSCKRSKAVDGCQRVVAIIGRGHLPGVVYHLLQDSSNLRSDSQIGDR